MARIQVKRHTPHIDMTAMSDVTFLLLNFFVMTAVFKTPEPMPVDTPASTVQIKVPDNDIAQVTVGEDKVFFSVAGPEVRARLLERMAEQYGVSFTPKEKKMFTLTDVFGVPMKNLKQFLNLNSSEQLKSPLQTGIPFDSVGNNPSELHQWILQSRYAEKEVRSQDLKFSIKGDKKMKYPEVKKVIDILQNQKVNKFSLITNLRNDDF
ncbi:ExbD/TolR family protein [Olivibacter jilunii]|uniref:ExbD/TolR family protein n=1 Tax=Olivibacter jilunii TaxID=985016 RepID=UPI003F13C86B